MNGFVAKTLCAFLVLFVTNHHVAVAKRRHYGPAAGQRETILHGRTVTDLDDDEQYADPGTEPDETALSTTRAPGDREDEAEVPKSTRLSGRNPRRIVDFALHLTRDIVIWDEAKDDGVTLQECSFDRVTRHAWFTLLGNGLETTDYKRGVVFVVEDFDFAECLGHDVPRLRGIDTADSQLFLAISHVVSTSSGRFQGDMHKSVRIFARFIPGSLVCPEVDIAVHDGPEPDAVEAMYAPVEYEDEPHSPWTAHFATRQSTPGTNGSTVLPSLAERIRVAEREIKISNTAKLSLRADVDVKIKNFKLKRSLKLKMTWRIDTTASVTADLSVSERLRDSRRTGELVRVPIPKLSFSIKIPVAGSMKAGGFLGVNWVSEMSVTRSLSAGFKASYTRKDAFSVQVLPPKISVSDAGSGGEGRGSFTVGPTGQTGVVARGFYGVRPLVGMGVKLKYKKLKPKKLLKFKKPFKTKRVDVSGNVGADFGVALSAGFRSPPYSAYSGRGFTVGRCSSCHAVRGTISIKGKNFGLQAVKNGDIEAEKTLVKNLFEIRVGTICALPQSCARLVK